MHLAAGAAALSGLPRMARAQSYPTRPARLIVGLAPGGTADILARLMGQWLTDRLGQSFVIENRPGAATNIAAEAVVRAPADGYTLLLISTGNAINTTLYEKLSFNFQQDIMPVVGTVHAPNVITTHPSFPAKTVPELIVYAKANPGRINMASSGSGTTSHVAGELFKMMTGVNMTHVPYRGGALALNDLLGGQVQIMFNTLATSIEFIRAGKVRALAVTTASRLAALPDVPAANEFVPGYESSTWWGLGLPRNTPAGIVETLNREINASFADARMKARFADLGLTAAPSSPGEFASYIAEETAKWAKVVKFAGLKPQ
jgi:tripartite-type tricarboxylate transporter receptor subunit TctC